MRGLISAEQQMFADAVKRFAEQEYGFGPAPHRLTFDHGRLARLAEMGCLSLAIPEEFGGIGGPVEAMVAMSTLAPALPPEPIVASGIHAAALIAAAATRQQAGRVLPRIADGSTVAVVADLEADARYDRTFVATAARREGTGYVLDGAKPGVPFAAEADVLVVSAALEGQPALFLVETGVAGLEREPVSRIDGLPAADVMLSACRLADDARLDRAPAVKAMARAADVGTAAILAEMVGLMDALCSATIEYASTRKQFGVPIGSFQALQHRIADMWVAAEESRSMAAAAAFACTDIPETRTYTISSAMLVACDAAEKIGNEAIQIHGGIGMTDEMIVSHWYRRLWALRQELGDRRFHLERLASAA